MKITRNKFLVIFLPIILPLIIISICIFQKLNKDSKYALHPFNNIIIFKSKYFIIDRKDKKSIFKTGNELRGKFPSKLADGEMHVFYYGEGALKRQGDAYLKYICKQQVLSEPKECYAKIEYIINPNTKSVKNPKNFKLMNLSYMTNESGTL